MSGRLALRNPGVNASTFHIILAFAIVYVIWGSTYLFIRFAIDTMPPLLMAGVRFLLAGGIMYAFARLGRRDPGPRPGWPQWRSCLIVGGLLFLVGNGGVTVAEERVPSGIVALVVATVPLWMAVLSHFFAGERLRRLAALGVGIGLFGTALLVRPGAYGGHTATGPILILLFSPLCWAAGSVYSRRAPLPADGLTSTALQMLCGGMLLTLVAVIAGEPARVHPNHFSLVSVLALLYLVSFGSWVAFSAYSWLLRVSPTSLVGTYAYVNPLVAIVLGWGFLGEPITGQTIVAGVLILVAVGLILSRPRQPQPRVEEPSSPEAAQVA